MRCVGRIRQALVVLLIVGRRSPSCRLCWFRHPLNPSRLTRSRRPLFTCVMKPAYARMAKTIGRRLLPVSVWPTICRWCPITSTDRSCRRTSLVTNRPLLRVRILKSYALLLGGRVRLMTWTLMVVIILRRVRRRCVRSRLVHRTRVRLSLWNPRSSSVCSLLWMWRVGALLVCVIWKVRPIDSQLVARLRWRVLRMLSTVWLRLLRMAVLLSFNSICLLVPIIRVAFA